MLCGATRSPHRENYSVLKLCRRASAKSLGYRLSGERRLFLEKKGSQLRPPLLREFTLRTTNWMKTAR
ncbi:hypothetical protein GBAR_LOCUS12868 [Geodia barretti]|uniref:Uncharacterized protein n=1 Tax=Geodia barretti TaxID=519541 RepID=A0AA35WLZ8_GEOBA|nr:hypothetical protein GBAR_LOCUS12868 [Geodia barretti]